MSNSKVPKKHRRSPTAWMAGNSVAANLLMFIFLVGGFLSYTQTKQEVFPEFTTDTVSVSVAYPGASPSEVEQGVILAIEDEIGEVDGIKEVTSKAQEGSGRVTAEIQSGEDLMRVSQDIKSAVDRVATFPLEAEEPIVTTDLRRRRVLKLTVYGDVSDRILREATEQIYDRLRADTEIGNVELQGARDFEIHIEVPQDILRRYGLTLEGIAQTVNRVAIERAGGTLETGSGDLIVRFKDRRDYADEFRSIPVIQSETGQSVLLGEIARIQDGFEEVDRYAEFEGKPAINLNVYRIGKQTPVTVSKAVKKHVEELNRNLPTGIQTKILDDSSEVFKQRADLLLRNGYLGLALVIILLGVFMDLRLAFWVSLGIPISFAGAFLFMPFGDTSINMVTMFAFIISLGIVVDDAVVVGENIHAYREKGHEPLEAAILGVKEVTAPVTFSVLTNIAAFMPLFFVPGVMGKIFMNIPAVVVAVFFVSLIESLFILPAHLAHSKKHGKKPGVLDRVENWQLALSRRVDHFINEHYKSFLERVIDFRYVALAIAIAALIVCIGFIASGRMGMSMFPRIEGDEASVMAVLPAGTPLSTVRQVEKRLIDAARYVITAQEEHVSEGVFSEIDENEIDMQVQLVSADKRELSTRQFVQQWRKKSGTIPGLELLTFTANRGGPGAGADLTIELSHSDVDTLESAAEWLGEKLKNYPIVSDIDDGTAKGKRQWDFKMNETAAALGLTSNDIAAQVRGSFYGMRAFRQQRGRNEVTVLVRLPKAERESEYDVEQLILRTPSGAEVMFRDVVDIQQGRAYTVINRRQSRRVVTVSADVDPPSAAGKVQTALEQDIVPELKRLFPGVTYGYEGKQADMAESLQSLFIGFIAALGIMYALLAILLNRFTQPLIVLFVIPFGIIGVIIGHLIMGYSLSIISMFGVLALSGVVINDSLLLVDFANKHHAQKETLHVAIVRAATRRFRPVVLTTLTTFVGVMPMMLETSMQARFLIPMVISLGFGIVFASAITLLIIPVLYVVLDDIHDIFGRLV